MNLFSLENKVAVVTGACGLIGREHCKALSEAGASVVVADIDGLKCKSFAAELGEKSFGIGMNVADKDSVANAKILILEKYGTLDILVNNAAINDMFENPLLAAEQSKFENYPLDMWEMSLHVNVTGVFLCSQILGTILAEKGKGSIINVASTYGMVAPDQSIYKDESGKQKFYKSASYPTTKGAILNFTRFLAAYWGEKGVRVNTLSPGGVENNQDEYFRSNYSNKTLLKRMATPTDYKGAIVFLASDASAYMTGANLVVDGGWTAI
jgi:NAD(P)-dependent dehydrogenase (short-subunit alcohol dehydrogenase family)